MFSSLGTGVDRADQLTLCGYEKLILFSENYTEHSAEQPGACLHPLRSPRKDVWALFWYGALRQRLQSSRIGKCQRLTIKGASWKSWVHAQKSDRLIDSGRRTWFLFATFATAT